MSYVLLDSWLPSPAQRGLPPLRDHRRTRHEAVQNGVAVR